MEVEPLALGLSHAVVGSVEHVLEPLPHGPNGGKVGIPQQLARLADMPLIQGLA